MKKSTVNSNHYLALGVSGSILICSILVFIYLYDRVNAQIISVNNAYSDMSQARLEESQARQLIGTLSSTQAQQIFLESFFVNDNQTLSFITQVEGIGKESGEASVTIASISDDDLSNSATGAKGSIHAHIDIQGSWPDAMRALHLMESLPYGESIDNLRANPSTNKKWNISFDLTAVLIHH